MDLKEYLDKNGIMKTWFAEQLGMSLSLLSNYLYGRCLMPTIYWDKVLVVTRGEVKFEDLVKGNNKYYVKTNRIPGKKWKNYQKRATPKKKDLDNTNSSQLSPEKKEKQTQ